jgi:L-ribulokinase
MIHAGGIPRRSPVINQVYSNVLNVPILVPQSDTTSLGSAIFAFLAAGTFRSVEEAQRALCPPFTTIEPDHSSAAACQELFGLFRELYFAVGRSDSEPIPLGRLLPALRRVAQASRNAAG